MPIVVLADWSEFRHRDFTPHLYDRLMGDWNPDVLSLDRYLDRIQMLLSAAGE